MSRLFSFIYQITYICLSVNRRLFVCKQTLSSAEEHTPGSGGAPSLQEKLILGRGRRAALTFHPVQY